MENIKADLKETIYEDGIRLVSDPVTAVIRERECACD